SLLVMIVTTLRSQYHLRKQVGSSDPIRLRGWYCPHARSQFEKKEGRNLAQRPSLVVPHESKLLVLERKLRTKTERRWGLYQQSCSVERIERRRNPRNSTVDRVRLIQSYRALAVEDIEPVAGKPEFPFLTNLDWVVNAQIKIHRGRRAV